MFNNKPLLPIVLIIMFIAVCASSYFTYNHINRSKTGYILIKEVFDGFDMTKDLEKVYASRKGMVQKQLDSIQFELQLKSSQLKSVKSPSEKELEIFNISRNEFLSRKQKQEEDIAKLKEEYDSQIITRINQYVSEYGKEHSYAYVFGNDANGTLMYARESDNITPVVIKYINEKYKGLK